MSEPTCKTCKWWKPWPDNYRGGHCRAHPPTVFYQEEMGDVVHRNRVCESIWPATNPDDMCGEHQPKEKE